MTLKEHLQKQLEEALGATNRYYCCEFYGREITDEETLLEHYIKRGGAAHFGQKRKSSLPVRDKVDAEMT